jgi:hypothetical protein
VEPTTPYATKTFEEEEAFKQQMISGRICLVRCGSSGNSRRSISSESSIQVSTVRKGGSTTKFTMDGKDPTIQLPKFRGEGSDDPEKHLFICEKIWEAKKITDKYTKVSQLEITFKDRALDWYMGLKVNNPTGEPTTIIDMKKQLINKFQKFRGSVHE